MPRRPTEKQLERMHEIAVNGVNPVEVVESLLNEAPELQELKKELIRQGIVQEVDANGRPVSNVPRPTPY